MCSARLLLSVGTTTTVQGAATHRQTDSGWGNASHVTMVVGRIRLNE